MRALSTCDVHCAAGASLNALDLTNQTWCDKLTLVMLWSRIDPWLIQMVSPSLKHTFTSLQLKVIMQLISIDSCTTREIYYKSRTIEAALFLSAD